MRYSDLYQYDLVGRNVLHLLHPHEPNLWTPILIDFNMAYASLPGYRLPPAHLAHKWLRMLYDAGRQSQSSVLDSVLSDPGVWFDEDDVEH
jgi:hypothetical protein